MMRNCDTNEMVKVIMCFYHFDQSINVEVEQSLRTFKGGLVSIRKEAQSGREKFVRSFKLVFACIELSIVLFLTHIYFHLIKER